MSTPAQKANLARIRDNQRRSRARRREYLQELEQRLRVYELQGVEASAEVQLAARRVAEENRQLRGLLNRHGFSDDYIGSYLHPGNVAQPDPISVSHFTAGNPGETVQSLQHIIAPRRPVPLDPNVSYSVNPPDSREASIASVSTSSSSIWEPTQTITSAYGRSIPSNLPQPMSRQSMSSQMTPQPYSTQVFTGASTPRTEAYHPQQSMGSMLDDPRHQAYPVVTIPSDGSSMPYNMSINPFHHQPGPDNGPSGGC